MLQLEEAHGHRLQLVLVAIIRVALELMILTGLTTQVTARGLLARRPEVYLVRQPSIGCDHRSHGPQ